MSADFSHIPIIDVTELVGEGLGKTGVASQIDRACREVGFFYIVGHGVDPELQHRLHKLSREFFAQPVEVKDQIAMSRGGRAWRGYFRVGNELTSGKPDQKEGLYFGQELPADHPLVRDGTPLHGPNLFPEKPAGLRETVLEYMAAMITLGQRLMAGIALGLGLDEHFFAEHGMRDPLTLFRNFNYPPPGLADLWGVGEHTDYGMLTILMQDDAGGLEAKSGSTWIPAPPLPGSFVCNIGDMLDRMTRGVYRSTPHRVRNPAVRSALAVTNRKKNTQSGQWEDEPMYIDIDAFNRGEHGTLANVVEQYCRKGSQICIEGRLHLETWDDKTSGQKRSKHKIVADQIQLLDGKPEGGDGAASRTQPPPWAAAPPQANRGYEPPPDDVPPSGSEEIPF